MVHRRRQAKWRGVVTRKRLLVCGILASLLYAAMNLFVPLLYPGYSYSSQTVSELAALGAPTRTLWVALSIVYVVLVAAFGIAWPPMSLRGSEQTMTDILHIVVALLILIIFILEIVLGALAFGRYFRLYSAVTLLLFLGFGALTVLESPRLAANLPTPWIGVWERITIGVYLLWVISLARRLLRERRGEVAGE